MFKRKKHYFFNLLHFFMQYAKKDFIDYVSQPEKQVKQAAEETQQQFLHEKQRIFHVEYLPELGNCSQHANKV